MYWMRSITFIACLLALISCQKNEPLDQLPSARVVATNVERLILLEPTVSVSCGACPLAHHAVEELEASSANVTHISHYLFGPLFHAYTKHLMDRINKTVYTPLVHVNRRHEDGSVVYYPIQMMKSIAELEQGVDPRISLESVTAVGASNIDVSIDVQTDDNNLWTPLRLTAVLVEKEVVGEGPG
jgi:hypothetical protein